MTILVTGGLGFIGSHFARMALSKGEKVIILDKFTYASNLRSIEDYENGLVAVLKSDIAVAKNLEAIFETHTDISYVINFAAESHVDRSISNAQPFIQSNIVGVSNLLEILQRGGFQKLIQISTDEVYGSIDNGTWDEASPLQPRSPYSASKASADLLCQAFRTTHNLDIAITRCANNYGSYQSVEKFIPKIITCALENKPIPVYGNGSYFREWVHVQDHVSAIYSVAQQEANSQDFIYNIGGTVMSNLELLRKILKIMGKPETLIEFVEDRKGHDYRYSVNDSHIRTKLLWEPSADFDTGLAETVDWYKKNPDWVNSSQEKVLL
jgi:dTDP-glucose 4,6-dehydratase